MKSMEGYKIVRRKKGRLLSCVVSRHENVEFVDLTKGCVEYIPGEWVEPLDGWGPLSLFQTYGDAVQFDLDWGYLVDAEGWEIWKCEYLPSGNTKLWGIVRGRVSGDELKVWKYWKPPGTRLATSIKLTGMVEKL